jgi:hypothetical protein
LRTEPDRGMTNGVSETKIPADLKAVNGCFDALTDEALTL